MSVYCRITVFLNYVFFNQLLNIASSGYIKANTVAMEVSKN